jgi:hypothetical protein
MAEICGTVVHFKVYNDAVKIVVVLFTNNIFIPHRTGIDFLWQLFWTRSSHQTKFQSKSTFQSRYVLTDTSNPPTPTPPHQHCAMFLRETLPPVKTGCGVIWYCLFDHSTLHPLERHHPYFPPNKPPTN